MLDNINIEFRKRNYIYYFTYVFIYYFLKYNFTLFKFIFN